jgi:outer membrane receptor protein involved in Fe transport
LRGVILDQQGGAVPNANVTATNENTNISVTTKSSTTGVYTFPDLLVGSYTLKAEAAGFRGYSRTGIQVLAAQTTDVTANLEVGALSTEVVVESAGSNIVQTESSQLSGTFQARAASEIPVITGSNLSVQNLAIFLPNTTTQLGGTSGYGGSIGGLRGRQNGFSIDGVDNLDPTVTVASQEVIGDAVQEFSVNENVYSAESGRGAGGQFNVITKTGTNNWHGSGWFYNVNRAYDAADNQEVQNIVKSVASDKRRYDFNRVGGDVGGPIIKNNFFIYGAYQFLDLNKQATAPTGLAPTAAAMTTLNSLAMDSQVQGILAQFPIAPVQTNIVTVKGMAIPVGTVTSVAPSFTHQMDYIINGDWNLTRQSLHVRYLKDRQRQPSFGASFPQAQFSVLEADDNRRVIINHVWTATSRLLNDFRTSYARFSQLFPLSGVAQTYPTLTVDDLAGIQIGPNQNLPQHRLYNEYLLGDTLSWTMGRHSFKTGGQYFWFISPSVFLQNERGQDGYQSLQQLILDQFPGKPNFTLQGVGNGFFEGNSKNFNLFLQDDLKVNERLTLNLGIRYDFFGNPSGAKLNALNSVASLPGTPLVFNVPKQDWNNVGPRLGFAWSPTKSGNWSVRGGAGISYDVIPWNFYTNSLPIQLQVVLTSRTAACAGTFGPPAAWCALPAGDGFLADGGMKINFVPLNTVKDSRAQTAQIMPDAKAPKVFSWSLSVERQLSANSMIELRYLGTRALELPVQLQLNSISPFELGALPLPTYIQASSVPANVPASAPTLALFTAAETRRYAAQGFTGGAITDIGPFGSSSYHGLAINYQHRVAHGLLVQTNYTYSKAMDDSTNDLNSSAVNPRRPQDSSNLRNERSRSTLDVRHKVALTFLYDTPKVNSNNRFVRGAMNGWEWSGSYLFQGGQPVTIQSGVDSNGNGDAAGDRAIVNPSGTEGVGSLVNRVCLGAGGTTTITVNATPTASSPAGCPTAKTVGYVAVNPNAKYIQAGVGTLSNLGRNTFDSPYFNIWNMAILNNHKLSERFGLQIRLEAFNVFNHPNFTFGSLTVIGGTSNNTNALNQGYANLAAGVAGGTFLNAPGLFTATVRQVQLGLKLTY